MSWENVSMKPALFVTNLPHFLGCIAALGAACCYGWSVCRLVCRSLCL